jgi:hypothetical protein
MIRVRLHYKHLERAVADVMGTPKDKMGALRARMRRLRDLGFSAWTRPGGGPGTGQVIKYSTQNVLEIVIALVMEDLGQSPKTAAQLSEEAMKAAEFAKKRPEREEGDLYIILEPSTTSRTPTQTLLHGNPEKRLADAAKRKIRPQAPAYSVLNFSFYEHATNEAIRRLAATD